MLLLLSAGLLTPTAGATRAESASLTMTSEEGDYIGGGQPHSYSTSANDVFDSSTTGRTVHIRLQGANGDWWYLDFAAPEGQTLAAGAYESATRYPFQDPGAPGLDVAGNGRGCNTLTGTFTVREIAFGPFGDLQSFDADFEQHCEGADPALRGRVQLVNPPAVEPLSIGLVLTSRGAADRASGRATVSGTVTCNRPTEVFVSGTLTQRASRFVVATGHFERQIACAGTTTWHATVRSDNDVPFNPGSAQLDARSYAYDEFRAQPVTATKSATIKLTR